MAAPPVAVAGLRRRAKAVTDAMLKRDDFSSNRHHALGCCRSMMFVRRGSQSALRLGLLIDALVDELEPLVEVLDLVDLGIHPALLVDLRRREFVRRGRRRRRWGRRLGGSFGGGRGRCRRRRGWGCRRGAGRGGRRSARGRRRRGRREARARIALRAAAHGQQQAAREEARGKRGVRAGICSVA